MKRIPFASIPHTPFWKGAPQPTKYFKKNFVRSIKLKNGGITKEQVAALPKGITVIEKH